MDEEDSRELIGTLDGIKSAIQSVDDRILDLNAKLDILIQVLNK